MIYVYAVTEPLDRPLPAINGLEEQPLVVGDGGAVSFIYSRHDRPDVRPTPENIWRHEAVAEALMQDRSMLPARFGATFRDISAVQEVIAARAAPFVDDLHRVRGCVEVGLRVLWRSNGALSSPAEESSDAPTSGRAYMLQRLHAEQRSRQDREAAEALVTGLHAALAPLARGDTRRVLASPEQVLSAAYLLRRERADEFAVRVRQLAAAHPDLRLLCTGPWPPYHFVSAFESAEVRHA